MNFNFESAVVIGDGGNVESNIRHKKSSWEASVTGAKIYPIGTLMPFIVRGRGCFGYATVKEFTVSAETTTIKFNVVYITDTSITGALYNMYRNSVTASGSADYEDSEDVVIPGLARGRSNPEYGKKKPTPRGWGGWSTDDDRRPLSSFSDD